MRTGAAVVDRPAAVAVGILPLPGNGIPRPVEVAGQLIEVVAPGTAA